MSEKKPVIVFKYRGQVERISSTWRVRSVGGYSEDSDRGLMTYPWNTRKECQDDARRRGCRAQFVAEGE